MKKYMTKGEYMDHSTLARSTVQKYMNMGMPFMRYKGKTYFEAAVCDEWVKTHQEEINLYETDDDLPEDFLEMMKEEEA